MCQRLIEEMKVGYYTRYEVNLLEGANSKIHDNLSLLEEVKVISGYTHGIVDVTWYDHDDDMKKLSKNNPGLLILLKGKGEGDGDIWKKFFKNGKMQSCPGKIVFVPFDESKLT